MTSARHLILDADDTLWETNVVFEQVIADFIAWLAHPELDDDDVRALLDDIQRANAAAHGYGTKMLVTSLHHLVERLADRRPSATERETIAALVRRLAWEEVEIIEGVPTTLEALGRRHDLVMLTKGDREEQQLKIDVSSLAGHFREIVIVREKRAATYRDVIAGLDLDPARTWMIGNSPHSDVLPALEAGIRAVWVPNPNTWRLEDGEVPEDDERVLTVGRFADLLEHF